MRSVVVRRRMTADDVAAVTRLLSAARRADGDRPLSDHMWLDLVHGGGPGFAAVLARARDDAELIAYAQLSTSNAGRELELVIDPARRDDDAEIATNLVTAALDEVAGDGGGRVLWWVADASSLHEDVARSAGLEAQGSLLQMRRELPTGMAAQIETRPFEVGRDEAAWLDVNNRAFAGHDEQGGWDVDTLRRREREPWFDPAGFLLHERHGRLAGFCWTKLHPHTEPPIGEIYVIAVDPDFRGLGLGKALTLAGLDWIAGQGIGTGMLYVDAANAAAYSMYDRLGFDVHRTDRSFVGTVAPRSSPSQLEPEPTR